MGPNLYMVPGGGFTHLHQDGNGTVDSGTCFSQYLLWGTLLHICLFSPNMLLLPFVSQKAIRALQATTKL